MFRLRNGYRAGKRGKSSPSLTLSLSHLQTPPMNLHALKVSSNLLTMNPRSNRSKTDVDPSTVEYANPRLPLDPVLVAISELLPKIQDTQRPSGAPSSKIFNLLKDSTTSESLLEHLPPAQPITPRKFQWSTQSSIWLTSLLWGDIYVAGLTSVGVWRDTTVRLFGVKQAVAVGRTAQVGRVLKRLGVV